MQRSDYRPDIDGLRALAVMSVLVFHVDIAAARGGFVGVDVFFVISGFLITRLVRRDVEAGYFRFSEFYVRRLRRLFPALFATASLTLLVGAVLLTPYALQRFGGALVSTLFWVSNFYFWTESGYFDQAAASKPLLHTWSLSVEEQFYLVWPAFIFLVCTKLGPRWIWSALGLACMLSFALGEWQLSTDPSAAFFLPFARIFEFGIGAMLVWIVPSQPKRTAWLELLLAAGIGLILWSVLSFDEATVFPGMNALVPCIGAALVIFAGQARFTGWLLRNPLSVYLGRISYSLYLVHWPIVVFYKYESFGLHRGEKVMLIAVSILAGALMSHGVEMRFRRARERSYTPQHFVLTCVLGSLFLTLLSMHAWMTGGWPWRWNVDPEILDIATHFDEKREASWQYVYEESGANRAGFAGGTSSRILIAGDSHSKDLFNAFYLNPDLFGMHEFRRSALHDDCLYLFAFDEVSRAGGEVRRSPERSSVCEEEVRAFKSRAALREADWVILAIRWNASHIADIAQFDAFLKRETGARLAMAGRTSEFRDVPKLALQYGSVSGLGAHLAEHRRDEIDKVNRKLLAMAERLGVPFLDRARVVCEAGWKECPAVDSEGKFLFYDYGHWTLEGARFFGREMGSRRSLESLLGRVSAGAR